MGTISQGILGGVSGKVGNVIGGSWKGIDYLRIMPASVANPQTPAQMDQRSKFVKVLNFLQPLVGFLRVGYKLYAIKMTQFNSAMSYILKNAVAGTYPNYVIDYANVLVSRGTLTKAEGTALTSPLANQVVVTWNDNSGTGDAKATDKTLLVVVDENNGESVYDIDGAIRSAGTLTFNVPSNFSGDEVHVYLGFKSEDGLSVANSTYVGTCSIT